MIFSEHVDEKEMGMQRQATNDSEPIASNRHRDGKHDQLQKGNPSPPLGVEVTQVQPNLQRPDGVLQFDRTDDFVRCATKRDSWVLTVAVIATEGIC